MTNNNEINLEGTLWEDSDNWETYVPCCEGECTCPGIVELTSVGTWLDTENGNTYPVSVDEDGNSWGDITDDNAIHLDDCCDEWFDSLSPEDEAIVGELI